MQILTATNMLLAKSIYVSDIITLSALLNKGHVSDERGHSFKKQLKKDSANLVFDTIRI